MGQGQSKGLRTAHSIMPWLVWLLAVGFYAYEFLQRVSVSVYLNQMLHDLSTDAASMGVMSACYYYAYAIMQLPAGTLVDRYGPKRLVLIGITLVVVGTLWFSSIDSVIAGSIARFLIGVGSAFAFVCTLQFIIIWFPQTKFAQLAGATNFMGYMGATLGEVPLAIAAHHLGWRKTALITTVFGIVLFILIAFIIKDKPVPHRKSAKHPHKLKIPNVFSGLKTVLTHRRNWFNGIYCGLVVGPTSAFAALWGIKFLTSVDHISRQAAAGALSTIFLGVAVGSPIFGWLSDRLQKRQLFLVIAGLGAAICSSVIIFANHLPLGILYAASIGFGFFQSAHVLCFANAKDDNHRHFSGTAISFINMALIIGGAVLQPTIGVLLDWLNKAHATHAHAFYSATSFHTALLILPICQVVAFAIAALFLQDKPSNHLSITR